MVPARYGRSTAPSRSSGLGVFVLALRDAGSFALRQKRSVSDFLF